MKWAAGISAVVITIECLGSVSADDLMALKATAAADAYLTICASEDFSADLARRTAEAQGWMKIPDISLSLNRPNMTVSKADGWALVPGDIYPSLVFLYVYEGNDLNMGDVEMCKLFFREPRSSDVMAALKEMTEIVTVERQAQAGGASEVFIMPEHGKLTGVAEYGTTDPLSIYLSATHKK